jgi:hypothetical protein
MVTNRLAIPEPRGAKRRFAGVRDVKSAVERANGREFD